ncbi:prepilin-type N-terminal cleavage/methylation domain-containing protein [Noviherbaspirillum massiliense]|uniref:prepilin-type N-terminal cleavage/methylation domain-containing protein n=1 Tax=Noviherbaspirillum massiliense TaxID=1465823 RepID=UPI00031DFDE6|nr:prepilin-type N-terminal cleavage/methylation domain-containing protein [Noviherbaspirillum massiliense]
MCISDRSIRNRHEQGLTLIELVLFIVIVSVGIAGILSVLNVTSRSSADPQVRKQALSIAEAMLEEIELARFTYCDPTDPAAETATKSIVGVVAGGCTSAATLENAGIEAGSSTERPYDNVNDYVNQFGIPKAYSTDANNKSFIIDGNTYNASVTIRQAAFPDGANAIPADSALMITVTVTDSQGNSITLDGYRTRYAPNALP